MPNHRQAQRKKNFYHYTVVFEREPDGGYHAFCPALKGCHSQGDTYDEAVENIKEAIALYLESLRAHGKSIKPKTLAGIIDDLGLTIKEFEEMICFRQTLCRLLWPLSFAYLLK